MQSLALAAILSPSGAFPMKMPTCNPSPSPPSGCRMRARTFPRAIRPADVVYNHLLLATRMVRKFPGLRMTPGAALEESRCGRAS